MADGPVAEENATPERSRRDPLSIVWHLFAAPQVLLIFMGLLALVLVLGTLLPQAVPQGAGEPPGWPVAQPGLHTGREGLAGALGPAGVYDSYWFRLLLALTCLAIFVRAVDAADLAWRVTRHAGWPYGSQPRWEAQADRFSFSTSVNPEAALGRIRQFLSRHGYRLADFGEGGDAFAARRRPQVLWARPLGYASLLLAALGLIIVDSWGWQEELWRPQPGDSRSVGHGRPYVLRLDRFDLEAGEAGHLQGHGSQVVWLEDGIVVHEAQVRVGEPATHDGVTVRSVGFVPVVTLRAWDRQGNPLPLETAGQDLRIRTQVEVSFVSPEEQPPVFMPGQDRFLLLAFQPRCGDAPPLLHVDLIGESGSEQVRLGSLAGSGELSGDGLRLDVVLAYAPLLRVDHRPGMALLVVALALALVALAVYWIAPPHLIWLTVEPRGQDETGIQLISLPALWARAKAAQMAGRVQGVLADDA